MKFQSKIIIVYGMVATFCAVLVGMFTYHYNFRAREQEKRDEMRVVATRLSGQIEEWMERMDASMNYILSDSDILSAIRLLGKGEEIPDAYRWGSEQEIRLGLGGDFMTKNAHRVLFYNRSGILIYSSRVQGGIVREDFDAASLSYLQKADASRGKTVLVGKHKDTCGDGDQTEVFSLVKALQGSNMGYLEIQYGIRDFEELKLLAEGMEFAVYIGGGEPLYASSEPLAAESMALWEGAEQGKSTGTLSDGNEVMTMCTEAGEYPFSLLLLSDVSAMRAQTMEAIGYSILQAALVFAISFGFVVICSTVLVKPIRRMQTVIERTNLDNLGHLDDTGIRKLDRERDEFQALAQAYQMMAGRLSGAIIREKKASVLHLQAMCDTLQAQVNPHFLYNTLNSISARGIEDDDDVICEMCRALAGMLRYASDNKKRYTSLREELCHLRDYEYLMKARYGEELSFTYQIPETLLEKRIPKVTLQQIVENCIEHGFRNHASVMRVAVEGSERERGWQICIRDNGEGFMLEALTALRARLQEVREQILARDTNIEMEIGGMGLANVYARCYLLYGENCIFLVGNGEDGGAWVTFGVYGKNVPSP